MFDFGNAVKELKCRLNVHFQHVSDRLALKLDAQSFAVEAMPFTHRASHPDVGQKVHLEFRGPISLTCLTSTAIHIEAKTPRLVSATFGLRQLRKQRADVIEYLDVGSGIGARRPTNRRLIDGDELVEKLQPIYCVVITWVTVTQIQIAAQRFDENVIHEGTLPRPGHTCHTNEGS